jgi:hypothetical protein
MAELVCGANKQQCATGMTVGEVRQNYKDILNIAEDAEVILNSQRVGDDYVLQETDSIEFIKKAGEKGVVSIVVI